MMEIGRDVENDPTFRAWDRAGSAMTMPATTPVAPFPLEAVKLPRRRRDDDLGLRPGDRSSRRIRGRARRSFISSTAGQGASLLDVESGKIHELPAGHASTLDATLRLGDAGRAELAALAFGIVSPAVDEFDAPRSVPVKAISLAVAQKCNLGCTYCYAQQGTFGGAAGNMPARCGQGRDRPADSRRPNPAKLSLWRSWAASRSSIATTLHASTRYAANEAAARGIRIGFSMTTNATLLRDEDIALFQQYGFTLTISLDGLKATHDRLRPYRSGKGSFEKVAENVRALLAVDQRRYRVLARVTVTPKQSRPSRDHGRPAGRWALMPSCSHPCSAHPPARTRCTRPIWTGYSIS